MSSSLTSLLVVSFLVGGCNGALVSLIPVLLVNDFGISRFTGSLGVSLFMCGIVTCFRPILDGYFRDVRGSYDGMFYIMLGLCIPCGLYWLYREVDKLRMNIRETVLKEQHDVKVQKV